MVLFMQHSFTRIDMKGENRIIWRSSNHCQMIIIDFDVYDKCLPNFTLCAKKKMLLIIYFYQKYK